MIELYRQMLEEVMFPPESSRGLVLVAGFMKPDATGGESRDSGTFALPRQLFPSTCAVRHLAPGAGFIAELHEAITSNNPQQLFLVPPFLDARRLPADLQTRYPRMNLEHVAIQIALELLPPEAALGVLLPVDSLSPERARSFREYLAEKAVIRYVIEHDFRPPILGIPVHPSFRLQTLIIQTGESLAPIIKFFKIPEANDPKEEDQILADLRRLVRQQGGATAHGFVLREGIRPGSKLLFDMQNPLLQRRMEEMGYFGQVQKLTEVVTIQSGIIFPARNAAGLTEKHSEGAIPLIEGRQILTDGSLSLEGVRYYLVNAPSERQLQANDIVLRALVSPHARLCAAIIRKDMLPLIASSSVLVLRKKPDASVDERFLQEYLRSDRASEWVHAQGISVSLQASLMQEMPVPLPDETLASALEGLRTARTTFEHWKQQAEQAISSVFDFQSARDARLHLLTSGRKLRQRLIAAEQTDDFRYRLRTQFPHPIAYRWRTVEAAKPDLEGYVQALETAEVSACLLACVAVALAQGVDGVQIRWLGEMSKRFAARGQGTNMGDWVAILREVRDAKSLRQTAGLIPFYEVSRFLDDAEVNDALQRLKERRDDQSHGRGPKGSDIAGEFDLCISDLEILLRSTEFLTEYPLRYIETTRRDSLRHTTEYEYRELMGDHPLVPLQTGQSGDAELEAESLYLADRTGVLHLMRPLLLRQECPDCRSRATFYLDTYDHESDTCSMKSMERGHTVQDQRISSAFRAVGLLPADTTRVKAG